MTVRTGNPARIEEMHLGLDSDRTRVFVESMHSKGLAMGPPIIEKLDLAGRERLLDVAGCAGTFSYLAMQKNPSLLCTVFDLPGIVQEGKRVISDYDTKGSIRFIEGDYHVDSFPHGQDVILLFGMLHQETEEMCKKLIGKAFDSLNSGGKVAILDMMLNKDKITPEFSTLFAVNMALTHKTGWVFSVDELKGWLRSKTFKNIQEKELTDFMPYNLLTAEKR